MTASGDHAAYLIRPDSVSSFAMPGPVPGMGAEGADGRDKPGRDEMRETSMTAYLISLALAGLVAIAVWEGFSWAGEDEFAMVRTLTEIRSLARSHTRTALNVLVGVMRSKDATAAARVSAANAILDRGWGKAPQAIENGENGALELVHRIERVIVHPENSDS
jgi:hypothetical protein